MRRILEHYRWSREVTLLASEWRALATQDVLDWLLRVGVLVRNAVGTHYSCGAGRPGCRRRVFAGFGNTATPWVARCSHHPAECAPVYLSDAQVEAYAWRHDAFVQVVRSALRLEGSVRDAESLCVQLGRMHRCGEDFEVFLVLGADPLVRAILAERSLAAQRSLVLVPTRLGIGPEHEARYGPRSRTMLGFLDDALGVEHGALVLRPAFERLFEAPASSADGWAVGNDGRRPITEVQAEQLVAARAEYDLFVDAIHKRRKGYLASYRDSAGKSKDMWLSRAQASALAELVSRRNQPTKLEDLAGLSGLNHPVRAWQRARKKVDVPMNGGRRSIVAVASDDSPCYVFDPPVRLRYLVLFREAGS